MLLRDVIPFCTWIPLWPPGHRRPPYVCKLFSLQRLDWTSYLMKHWTQSMCKICLLFLEIKLIYFFFFFDTALCRIPEASLGFIWRIRFAHLEDLVWRSSKEPGSLSAVLTNHHHHRVDSCKFSTDSWSTSDSFSLLSRIKACELWGNSVGWGACHTAWHPGVELRNLQATRKREVTRQRCPLTTSQALGTYTTTHSSCAHTMIKILKQINNNKELIQITRLIGHLGPSFPRRNIEKCSWDLPQTQGSTVE